MGSEHFSINKYAEVLAHIVYFRGMSQPEILNRLGVDREAWRVADAKWLEAFQQETLEPERPTIGAFSASFVPILTRLRTEKPVFESIEPPAEHPPDPAAIRVDPAVVKAVTSSRGPIYEPPAPRPIEVPTYLLPRQLEEPSVLPQRMRGFASGDETQEIDTVKVERPVVPFCAGPGTLRVDTPGAEHQRRFLGAPAGETANLTELLSEIFPFRSQTVVEHGGHKGIAHSGTVNLSDFVAGMNVRQKDASSTVVSGQDGLAFTGIDGAEETQPMNILAVRRPVMPFRAVPGTLKMKPSTPEKGRGFVGAPAGETANLTEFMEEVFPFGSGLPARQPERREIPHAGTVNLSDFVAQMNAGQEDRPSAVGSGQTTRGLSWLDDTDETQTMPVLAAQRPVTPFRPAPMASSAEPSGPKIRPVFLGAAADEAASVPEVVAESVPVVEPSAPKGAAHAGTMNLTSFVAGMTIQREDRPVTATAATLKKSPALSLELHAAFCAELAMWPGRTKATLSNYSLTESERATVDAYWRERTAANPAMAAAWSLAYAAAWEVLDVR